MAEVKNLWEEMQENIKREQAGKGLTIETHPGFDISPEVREQAISEAKDYLDELGINTDGTGRINVCLGGDMSRIEYVNNETRVPLLWLDNKDPQKRFFDSDEMTWTQMKDMIHQLDAGEHIPVEGADAREPGPEQEAQYERERAEEVQAMMAGDMDNEKADDEHFKSEVKKFNEPDRKELKEEIKQLKEEREALVEKAMHELSIMKVQGGEPSDCKYINNIITEINNKGAKIEEKQMELRSDVAKAVLTSPTRAAKAMGRGIYNLGRKMINSTKEALAKIADRLALANKRAVERRHDAYASVAHDITQIHRDWKHVNYTFEKAQVRMIDALQKHLVKAYAKNMQRTAARKNIRGDIKQFFTKTPHKHYEAEGLTEKQMAKLESLQKAKESINEDAEKYFASYNRSAVKDLARLQKRKDNREVLGMSSHKNLSADIRKIQGQMKAEKRASKDYMHREEKTIAKEETEKEF
ncbi:MAG: hypothetical protein ACI4CS_03730 [Candidatus Weimeria sp.]